MFLSHCCTAFWLRLSLFWTKERDWIKMRSTPDQRIDILLIPDLLKERKSRLTIIMIKGHTQSFSTEVSLVLSLSYSKTGLYLQKLLKWAIFFHVGRTEEQRWYKIKTPAARYRLNIEYTVLNARLLLIPIRKKCTRSYTAKHCTQQIAKKGGGDFWFSNITHWFVRSLAAWLWVWFFGFTFIYAWSCFEHVLDRPLQCIQFRQAGEKGDLKFRFLNQFPYKYICFEIPYMTFAGKQITSSHIT